MLENEGVALRSIRWSEIFPWLGIAKSFRLAVTLRLMIFGAIAVLLTLLGWWEIAGLFSRGEVRNSSWNDSFPGQTAWQVIDRSVPNRPFAGRGPAVDVSLPPKQPIAGAILTGDSPGLEIQALSPLIHTWALLSGPVWRILSLRPPTAGESPSFTDFLSLLISAIWSLAVWAYFGAAIGRVAAVQLATGEQVGFSAALRWANSKWLAYFSAPVIPMIGVSLVVLPILVLGLLMKADFLAVVVALVWPLALLVGLIMTILLIGVLLGWPLMWATISVEGTDSFDALNRTYAYVFQRPFRYFLYAVVGAVIGWLGWIVVENFAASVVWLASWAARWGAGAAQMPGTALSILAFWNGWVKLLAIGYSFSFFSVASTAIYYLLRRDVDGRETDEVYLDADASERKFGLPNLKKDAAGAPEIVEGTVAGTESGDGKVDEE